MGVIWIVLIFSNVITYFFFRGIAIAFNKVMKKEVLGLRSFGSVGVLALLGVGIWYVHAYLVNRSQLNGLSAYEQGYYVGRLEGIVIGPAVIVLVVVGIRGWLAGRKKNVAPATP
jgi:hypothetical protein